MTLAALCPLVLLRLKMHPSTFWKTWWTFDPADDSLFAAAYHGFNLCEGLAWCSLALLVLRRYVKHRHSAVELAYALAFASFGASDFREAYALESWLIAAKGVNLVVLLALPAYVLRHFYPLSKTF